MLLTEEIMRGRICLVTQKGFLGDKIYDLQFIHLEKFKQEVLRTGDGHGQDRRISGDLMVCLFLVRLGR